jgi:hypothetical protein
LPQNFIHRLAFRQLVDQLVQLANFPHDRFFGVFHADAANDACDQGTRRIRPERFRKERFEVSLLFNSIGIN